MGFNWQMIVTLILLAVLGFLGIASFIVKKKPEAQELIAKLAKISGPIGIVSALWGLYMLIDALNTMGPFIHIVFLLVVTVLVFIVLGFVFGYGMVTTYLSAEAKAKGEQLRMKLVAFQIPLGFVSLGLVVWWLLYIIAH